MKLDRFIERPVLSTVISILIVILGVLGLLSIPVLQYPDIAPPQVSVSATYTGANSTTVLNSVVAPLENQINGVENMMYMTSSATNTGSAQITVYFKQGTNADMAAVNVQNRVSMAQGLLPQEVTQIGVTTQKRQNAMLVVFSLYDKANKYSMEFVENYAKINLIPEIQRISGVGDAKVLGQDYSMRIWLKPDVMAQYNLVPSDISAVLAEQNIEAAPGQFGEDTQNQSYQYTIRYKGRLQKPEEFEQMVVKALPDGEVLRLKDVARVELGRMDYSVTNQVDGHKAVTCIVYQMAGTNATQTVKDIQNQLDKASEQLPNGLEINTVMNVNDFLFASIHEVIKTLLEAFVLVFIVVYVFLQDLRSTLIPAIAIPVALIGTFFVLNLIGFSMNLLTLCALVLAIAIVVDDAIVVVEGVHAKLDQGYKSSHEASIDAMGELSGAIVSITLVMMAVFVPVSFMSGTSGTFYRQFGVTMAVSIGLSALNALTLSPALCALLLKPHDPTKQKKTTFISRFHTAFNAGYSNLLKGYKKRVVWLIHKKWISFGLVGLAIAITALLMSTTPTAMVPNEDQGTIMCAVTLPPGTSKARTDKVLQQVDSLIASDPAIQSRTLISGFSFLGGQGPSYACGFIRMKPWEERSVLQSADITYMTLFMRAQKLFKDAQVLFFTPPMVPGYSATSNIEVNMQDKTGGDLDKFYKIVQNYMAELQKRPEIQSAQTSFNPKFPQYMIDIDAAACKRAGISPKDILSTMQGYYGGLYASNFNRFGRMYRVMVQSEPLSRENLKTLNQVKVRGQNGEMAPITQFMSIKKVYGPDLINRFNMFTSITLQVAPNSGYTSGQALQAISEVAKTLPQGYSYELGGMAREEAETSGSTTGLIFLLCFVFVYLLLSAQYESYLLPLAVLLSIPFGLMGSFLFVNGYAALGNIQALKLILGQMSNNIYMQIALIMLMGLLAKNAILIVEFALDRRRQGMSIAWAAVLGASARLRPLLMTSLALIIGLLPLMFAFGVGGNGNRTLGTAAIGGMLIGTIFQVFVVPVLFIVFEYLQEKVKPLKWDDTKSDEVAPELEQYVNKR